MNPAEMALDGYGRQAPFVSQHPDGERVTAVVDRLSSLNPYDILDIGHADIEVLRSHG